MQDRFNTIAGWTLFAGIVALGVTSLSGHYFGADKHHRPDKMGYAIAGVEIESEAGAPAVALETLLASADPAKGQKSFAKCMSCHTANQGGANGTGPNLFGIMGKPIGKVAGYTYSPDLAGKGGTWDFASFDAWIKNPKAFASGTKMSYPGMADPQERANLAVWMNTQGSNLPLPAAPAAAAPAEGAAPAADAPAQAPAEPAKK